MYREEGCKICCDFIHCLAGMGEAGNGQCFLNGAWWMTSCPNFADEDECLDQWRKEENDRKMQDLPLLSNK